MPIFATAATRRKYIFGTTLCVIRAIDHGQYLPTILTVYITVCTRVVHTLPGMVIPRVSCNVRSSTLTRVYGRHASPYEERPRAQSPRLSNRGSAMLLRVVYPQFARLLRALGPSKVWANSSVLSILHIYLAEPLALY